MTRTSRSDAGRNGALWRKSTERDDRVAVFRGCCAVPNQQHGCWCRRVWAVAAFSAHWIGSGGRRKPVLAIPWRLSEGSESTRACVQNPRLIAKTQHRHATWSLRRRWHQSVWELSRFCIDASRCVESQLPMAPERCVKPHVPALIPHASFILSPRWGQEDVRRSIPVSRRF